MDDTNGDTFVMNPAMQSTLDSIRKVITEQIELNSQFGQNLSEIPHDSFVDGYKRNICQWINQIANEHGVESSIEVNVESTGCNDYDKAAFRVSIAADQVDERVMAFLELMREIYQGSLEGVDEWK